MIDKIAKLLTLAADNANVHEAGAALMAARRLMREHQISESQVQAHIERADMGSRKTPGFFTSVWETRLAAFVQWYIGTVCIIRTKRPGKRRKSFEWFGRSADIEWADMLFCKLHASICWQCEKAGWSTTIEDGRSFALGFVSGLWESTGDNKDPEPQAIVLAHAKAKEYANHCAGRAIPTAKNPKMGRVEASAWMQGLEAGKAESLASAALDKPPPRMLAAAH